MLGIRCYVLGVASGQEPKEEPPLGALAPSHASSAHLFFWSSRLAPSDAEKHPRAPAAFFSNESACRQAGRVLLSIQARAPRGPNLSSSPINNHLVIYQPLCPAQTAKLPLPKFPSCSLPIPSSAFSLTIGNARSCSTTRPASLPPRLALISPAKPAPSSP